MDRKILMTGKQYRKGISLAALFDMFPDDEAAEAWFVKSRWPDGIRCAHCESANINDSVKHRTMPYHCRNCRKHFSVKTNSVMHSSKVGCQKWAIAIYLMTTNLKGVSSLKLHRDLGVTQKTAWHMAHRIREAWEDHTGLFTGEVEADETFVGGKRKNKRKPEPEGPYQGWYGKTPVAGMYERETKRVKTQVVKSVDAFTLQNFVTQGTTEDALIYTDEAGVYMTLHRRRKHETIKHRAGQYARGRAYTNSLESFWSMFKRGYMGVYHQMSRKHIHRYVTEFQGRHNQRPLNTEEQMRNIVQGAAGKRLRYKDLTS